MIDRAVELVGNDREELISRRLTEKVFESVVKSLRSRFWWATFIALVLGALGGSALLSELVQLRVDDKIKDIEARVDQKLDMLQDKISQASFKATQADELLTKTRGTLSETQSALIDANRKLASLQDTEQTLAAQQDDYKANIDTANTSSIAFQQKIADLADAVSRLNVGNSVANNADVAQSLKKVRAKTVFVQLNGDLSPDQADGIRQALSQDNQTIVPEVEHRRFTGYSNVRYFYDSDIDFATQVGMEASNLIRQKNLGSPYVKVANFTGYSGVKPPRGTIELWLNVAK